MRAAFTRDEGESRNGGRAVKDGRAEGHPLCTSRARKSGEGAAEAAARVTLDPPGDRPHYPASGREGGDSRSRRDGSASGPREHAASVSRGGQPDRSIRFHSRRGERGTSLNR